MTHAEFIVDLTASRKLAFAFLKNLPIHRDEHIVDTFANDVYMAAIAFNGFGEFRPYILQQARFLRGKLCAHAKTFENSISNIPAEYDAATQSEEDVKSMLEGLSAEHQSILFDRYSGYTFEEIGEKHGFSKQRANMIYQEAIQQVREMQAA